MLKMNKKILSLLLAVMLVFGILPGGLVLAEELPYDLYVSVEEAEIQLGSTMQYQH